MSEKEEIITKHNADILSQKHCKWMVISLNQLLENPFFISIFLFKKEIVSGFRIKSGVIKNVCTK